MGGQGGLRRVSGGSQGGSVAPDCAARTGCRFRKSFRGNKDPEDRFIWTRERKGTMLTKVASLRELTTLAEVEC